MRTDYSPYVRPSDEGKVWWRLEDAIKLAAGYLPVRDDNGEIHLLAGALEGNASEKAGRRNQILVSEKMLHSKLSEISQSEGNSWVLRRDDAPYFDAEKFLEWLWNHQVELDIDYPHELDEQLLSAIESSSKAECSQYIAYPIAMDILRKNLGATPEELAMWLFFEDSGIAGYLNPNELDPPPKFSYVPYATRGKFNYLKPLNSCWFASDDIANFKPEYRYITGRQLIERWANYPDIFPEEFIKEMIGESRRINGRWESRLIDGHPIMGLTQGSNPGDPSSPPLEDALFRIDQIEEIELSDFPDPNGPRANQQMAPPISPIDQHNPLPEPTGGDSLTPIIWDICNRMYLEKKMIKPRFVMNELKGIRNDVIVGTTAGGIKFETGGGDQKELTVDALRARIKVWRKTQSRGHPESTAG